MKIRKTGIISAGWLLSLLIVIIAVGFSRDFLFKSINALLKAWDYDQDYYLAPALSFLENYDYDTLLNLKWMLTFAFAGIYLLISIAGLRFVFGDNRYRRICVLTYTGLLVISAVFILAGFFSENSEKMYEFARFLMGMAQSPVLLMILIPALKLAEKEKNKTKAS